MQLTPIQLSPCEFPPEIARLIEGASTYDSSCNITARTYYIDRDCGYFLKIAEKDFLKNEAIMFRYFNQKGISARVHEYISTDRDYLITEKINGSDGISQIHLDDPKRLCDVFSQSLSMLHSIDPSDCPIKGRTARMYKEAIEKYQADKSDP